MKKYKSLTLLINLGLLLIFFNYSIVKKETILSEGKLVLLELAPVDPRSLMQGDYMELRYAISDEVAIDSVSKRGFCVVQLQPNDIAKKVRIQSGKKPLLNNEYLIEYTIVDWSLHIGAESFFFEEGQSKKFEKAKFGGIKINKEGTSILIGLYDEQLKKIL